jgi:hypothetical protein
MAQIVYLYLKQSIVTLTSDMSILRIMIKCVRDGKKRLKLLVTVTNLRAVRERRHVLYSLDAKRTYIRISIVKLITRHCIRRHFRAVYLIQDG